MGDDHKSSQSTSLVPVRHATVSEPPSLPMLPGSSGAVFGTRTDIARKDSEFVKAHAELIRARTEQSDAMRGLVESRVALAATLARLASIGELTQYDYARGRLDRTHELRMLALRCETDQLHAEVKLIEARQAITRLTPTPAPPAAPPPAPPPGLSPDEVDELLASLPEISAETRHTLALLLKGYLKEKQA